MLKEAKTAVLIDIHGVLVEEENITLGLLQQILAKKSDLQFKFKAIQRMLYNNTLPCLTIGAIDMLNQLHDSAIPIALVTQGSESETNFLCELYELKNWFPPHAIIRADMTGKTKEFPEPFQLAADRLGVDPSHCIVIEDSVFGVAGALAANIGKIIVVNFPNPVEHERLTYVDSLEDIQWDSLI